MIFAILFVVFPALSFGLTCEDFISAVQEKVNANNFSNLTTQEQLFFETSAPPKSALGLGDIEGCNADSSMKYYVALRVYYVTLGFKTGNDHGVCLPKECSTLYESKDQALLTKLFNVRQWTIAQGNKLELYDPDSPISSKTPVFYITCLLFAFFIGSSIVSTIVVRFHEKNKYKKVVDTPLHHDNFHADDHGHDHEHDHDHNDHHDAIHDHDHDEHALHDKHTSDHHEVPEKPLHWFFKAFDLKENFLALVKTAKEHNLDENMEVIDILKIGTVCYVLYANTFSPYTKLLVNSQSYTDFFKTTTSTLQMSGDFTSEYFFVFAGFLFAHKLIPQLIKAGKFGFGIFFRLLRQRFFVIYPLFIMAFLFYWQIIPQTFTGPLGYNYKWEVAACDKVAWTKLFFIENLTNGATVKGAGGYCEPTVWYVPAEFQVYIVGVLVFALWVRNRRLGYIVSILFYLQGFGLAIAAFYKYDLTYDISYPTLYETKFKWIPWKRWENFFLGAIFGMMYYEYSHNNKKNIFYIWETKPLLAYITMFFGAGLNMFLVFFLVSRNTEPSIWSEDLRHMWFAIRIVLTGLSVMLFFMPMAAHRTFLLKKILTLRFFQIFSRYTVDLYIFHQGINYAMFYSSTKDIETFSHSQVCVHTIVVILIGEVVATVTHLCIERPLIKIEAKIAEEDKRYHPMTAIAHTEAVKPIKALSPETIELPKLLSGISTKSSALEMTTPGNSDIGLKK